MARPTALDMASAERETKRHLGAVRGFAHAARRVADADAAHAPAADRRWRGAPCAPSACVADRPTWPMREPGIRPGTCPFEGHTSTQTRAQDASCSAPLLATALPPSCLDDALVTCAGVSLAPCHEGCGSRGASRCSSRAKAARTECPPPCARDLRQRPLVSSGCHRPGLGRGGGASVQIPTSSETSVAGW